MGLASESHEDRVAIIDAELLDPEATYAALIFANAFSDRNSINHYSIQPYLDCCATARSPSSLHNFHETFAARASAFAQQCAVSLGSGQ